MLVKMLLEVLQIGSFNLNDEEWCFCASWRLKHELVVRADYFAEESQLGFHLNIDAVAIVFEVASIEMEAEVLEDFVDEHSRLALDGVGFLLATKAGFDRLQALH